MVEQPDVLQRFFCNDHPPRLLGGIRNSTTRTKVIEKDYSLAIGIERISESQIRWHRPETDQLALSVFMELEQIINLMLIAWSIRAGGVEKW
jgi:hypothetical protein